MEQKIEQAAECMVHSTFELVENSMKLATEVIDSTGEQLENTMFTVSMVNTVNTVTLYNPKHIANKVNRHL